MRLQALLRAGVVCFDGGFGSELTARGVAFDCAEALNLTQPDAVRAIHEGYVRAGAQAVEANTLGANPVRLRAHGLDGQTAEIVRAAIGHVRDAGADCVVCPMGTTARPMTPWDDFSFEETLACFTVPAQAAKEAGADCILTETLINLSEARAMWAAARGANLPFAASFTFLPSGLTPAGNPPEACALTAWAMGAVMVGVNCMSDGALLHDTVRRMRSVCPLPILVQPSAGIPQQVDGALRYPLGLSALSALWQDALSSGAAALGGCCGTTPAQIATLAARLRSLPPPPPAHNDTIYICNAFTHLPLAQALDRFETMTPDTLAPTNALAVMLDLRGCSPQRAREAVHRASRLLPCPLLLRADDLQALDAALQAYSGVAAVDAPFTPHWGALRL